MHALRRSRQRRPEPACVKTCPTGAIHFGTKKEMLELAEQRVAKLKARGYEHAGVYNPEGVGGTHVMYVLHHADQPELYHGLPKDPEDRHLGKPVERRVETAGSGWLYCHFCRVDFPLHRYWPE